jgi:predicted RNase H-like nuclease (RuvC/YqgF family)
MNEIKQRHHDGKEYLEKIAEKYRKLIRLSSPTDAEFESIKEIMELAGCDKELDNLINQEDKRYAEENNLLEDDCLYEEFSSNQELSSSANLTVVKNENNLGNVKYKSKDDTPKSKNSSNVILFPRSTKSHLEKKRKLFGFGIGIAIPYFVAGGLLTFFGVIQLYNSFNYEKEPSFEYVEVPSQFYEGFSVQNVNNYLLNNANNTDTQMSVCNSNDNVPNQDIKKYYATFKNLEDQVTTQQIQPLEIRNKVRELQRKAEMEQKKAELNQHYAESQKKQAEIQHHYKKAQKLKDEANTLLSESRQWLCLSRQALILSTSQ